MVSWGTEKDRTALVTGDRGLQLQAVNNNTSWYGS